MNIYKVGVSGWVEVVVEAESEEAAREYVVEYAPDAAGELYDMVVEDIELVPEEVSK